MDRFDSPLPAGEGGQYFRGPADGVQGGDAVDDLLGRGLAVQVEGIAANAHDLGGVREIDAVGAGDPDGAADDPAVAAVGGSVVRCSAAARADLVIDGALQAGLVALDGQQVVRFAFPGDISGGVMLGVGGVGGDHPYRVM